LVNLGELSKELSDTAGLYIPPDTMLEDLPKVMLTVLRQKKLDASSEEDDAEVVETTSVFMSLPEGTKMPISRQAAEEIVSLGAINPKTTKPFTLEDFDVKPDKQQVYMSAVTKELIETKKDALRARVKSLVDTGRTTKEYADTKIYPMVEAYELSLGDNASFQKNNVDHVIESLESIPVVVKPNKAVTMPNDATVNLSVHDTNDDGSVELSADEAKEMTSMLLSFM
jgi:hypothetical protein